MYLHLHDCCCCCCCCISNRMRISIQGLTGCIGPGHACCLPVGLSACRHHC
ncbi:uncharacterized protein Dwil_GK27416 [Drosophila willistoni]|uniref:Uncharacterized protein n=1 Tax=Drosophila willistoni TaxID=7260 RepID=A0A0Q9WUH8_DROWI|nr:uncharacterized protein Dwil_GK27416 [Drosophila willistoni]